MTVLPSHNPNPFEPTLLSTIYLKHCSNLHNFLVLFSIFLLQSTNPDPTSEPQPILPPTSPPNHKFNWLNLLFLISIFPSHHRTLILHPTHSPTNKSPQRKPLPYRTTSSLCPHFLTLHCILLILLLPTSPLNHKLKYSIFCSWLEDSVLESYVATHQHTLVLLLTHYLYKTPPPPQSYHLLTWTPHVSLPPWVIVKYIFCDTRKTFKVLFLMRRINVRATT